MTDLCQISFVNMISLTFIIFVLSADAVMVSFNYTGCPADGQWVTDVTITPCLGEPCKFNSYTAYAFDIRYMPKRFADGSHELSFVSSQRGNTILQS